MEAETSSRDLLQGFAGTATISGHAPPEATASDEIELSLSLGGGFSSNPREKANTLIRSSSISSFPFLELKEENESSSVQVGPAQLLLRTCSLPVPGPGPDEEYKKRKEMQSLKRMEAKRKRDEKRNGLNSKGEEHVQCAGGRRGLPPVSQGSIGSVGSSNSTLGFESGKFSKFSKADQGTSLKASDDDHTTTVTAATMAATPIERTGSGMSDMPFVSTRGLGPHGKRIEGFLYKYGRGEEVRIVCVCHGKFLTPAEFVRHAGGGEVDHPLRHIVVTPSPSASLF